ncbi:MAG: TetR family transcriptional regulator, partial [Burkholderiales bacterium]|nr:TetR family transcriptional regulator [Burkholderiales bacterium]
MLKAAAERFAEHGFAGTSVRDITRSAGCNIAAVNYYFGSKEELYTAVFEARFAELRDYRIGALRGIMQRADLTLELVLRTFATAFLEPLIEESRGRQTLQLFMRDLVSSRLPEGMMVEQMIKPTSVALLDALRRVCPDIDTKSAQLCMHSLVAQLIHILQAQRLMAHIHTPLKP